MKNWIIGVLVVVVLAGGAYMLWGDQRENSTTNDQVDSDASVNLKGDLGVDAALESENKDRTVIGTSVEGRDIVAYHYGTGTEEVVLIGGIHGGYSWNTSILGYGIRDYLKANPTAIPSNLKMTVIPDLNPDGLYKLVGTTTPFIRVDASMPVAMTVASRFNVNNVDLSRNFDCGWQPTGVWQNKKVSGGSSAFSEPESRAIRTYLETDHPAGAPKAVVVYYSAAGGVYASACGAGILPETSAITSSYAKASGYKAYDTFDAYPTSGDIVNWLAKKNIPAISVLLTNHTDIELDKNLAGIKSVLARYAK